MRKDTKQKLIALVVVLAVIGVFVGFSKYKEVRYTNKINAQLEEQGMSTDLYIKGNIATVGEKSLSLETKKTSYADVKKHYEKYLADNNVEQVNNYETDELVEVGMYYAQYAEKGMESWMYQGNFPDSEQSITIQLNESPVGLKDTYTTVYIGIADEPAEEFDLSSIFGAQDSLESDIEMIDPETQHGEDSPDLEAQEPAENVDDQAPASADEESAENVDDKAPEITDEEPAENVDDSATKAE